ncbi:Caspase-8 [Frankliniella fusca]|uniref:Caspase-8 n=1 Tax=Frankliniella fusca TaxID=407009 RepID=A0AAE1H511_9NEOP|nr:Caspase-8 [Frankliniella fusca]
MSSTMTSISVFDIAKVEPRLDPSEICSLIFLLYDHEEIALQHIQREILLTKNHLQVLDSTLFKPAESYHGGALAQWARDSKNKDEFWQDKVLEALLIIKNYQVIRLLGQSKENLELKYLPKQVHTHYQVDLVRKALYLMMEDLSNQEWSLLLDYLIEDETNDLKSIPPMFWETREYVLTFLMSRKVLQTKNEKRKMDFVKLRSALKNANLCHWSEKLKSLEDLMNRVQKDIEEDDSRECHSGRETAETICRFLRTSSLDLSTPACLAFSLPRFKLDPANQGTILIFNMEGYNDAKHSRRNGSKVDRDRLKDTFELLNFNVVCYDDLPSKEVCRKIQNHLKEFCLSAKQKKVERCFIVAILAHGQEDGLIGTDECVIEWKAIRQELRSANTVGLPRMLLIQACKGNSQATKILEVVEDGPANSKIVTGNLKDLYEFSSSVPGFAAFRSPTFGSFFIHSFCKYLLLRGKYDDVQMLAAHVNRDFDNYDLKTTDGHPVELTSDLSVAPTKKLYLELPKENELKAKNLLSEWKTIMEKQVPQEKKKGSPTSEENHSPCGSEGSVTQRQHSTRTEQIYQRILKDIKENYK